MAEPAYTTDLFCVEQIAAECDLPNHKRRAVLEIVSRHTAGLRQQIDTLESELAKGGETNG